MPGLVHGHVFGVGDRAGRQPPRARREERRVLHATRATLPRRVDDRDVPVRVRAEPLAVVAEGGARGVEVTRGLPGVLWLEQETHRYVGQAFVPEALDPLDVVRARRPGEIVHVLRIVMMRRRAVALIAAATFDAGRADDPAARNDQLDVVDAEVREKLRCGMELMAVPAGVLEDADLGKPLAEEVVVADRAGAGERPRHARGPGDLDVDRLPGRDRSGERDLRHRPIVHVPVVRCDEAHRRRHVDWRSTRADELQAGDIDPAPVRLRTLGQLREARERDLAHPRRPRVPPRVVIEVESEAGGRNGRGVAPGEELLAGERSARRIEAGRDRIARVARRSRLIRRWSDDRRTGRVAPPWLRRRRLPGTAGERQRQHDQAACDAPDGGGSPEHDGILPRALRLKA